MDLVRKLKRRARYALNLGKRVAGSEPRAEALDLFLSNAAEMTAPRVLELGTRRSFPELSNRHDSWVPNASEFVGTDIQRDLDVDTVADVHQLSEVFGAESFDIIISCSTFEHFKYPHVAAHQVMKTLKVGGILYLQTHHSYPLHAAPYDYFRFSTEALATLFGTCMGFEVIKTEYQFPVRLFAREDPELRYFTDYLNTQLYGRKTAATPKEYVYEYGA